MKIERYIQKHQLNKKILALILAGTVGAVCCQPVFASVIKNAESKKAEAQENLNEVNRQINEIHAAQNSLQAQMNAYDNELMALLTDMDILRSDMEAQELKIEEADAMLEAAKEEEQTQYEAMKQRIQYMYENGSQSFVTALVGAESFTDFLNRIEYVSEVYEYDRTLLAEYQETVAEVEDLTVQLDNEMEEMEELELSYEEQQSSLEAIIAQKSAELDGFNAQLVNAQSLASQYAQTVREQNQIIEKEKARQEAERKKAEEAKKKAAAAAAAAAAANASKSSEQKQTSAGTANTTAGSEKAAGTDGVSQATETPSAPASTSTSTGTSGLTDSGLNPSYTTGVSGSSVVSYAAQFLGAPYVLGGNSLTTGTDCSYFVKAVFGNFGITLPRTSSEIAGCGKAVSYENAKAGDIICYPGHVAIYIGNGQIIHASTPKTGVCYGTATYRTISTIRRVL